jgi:hypothetical protein
VVLLWKPEKWQAVCRLFTGSHPLCPLFAYPALGLIVLFCAGQRFPPHRQLVRFVPRARGCVVRGISLARPSVLIDSQESDELACATTSRR